MPALTKAERQAKLQRLAELLGFKTVDEMFDAAVSDTACPGICINPWCEHVATVAPDESAGLVDFPKERAFCECEAPKVVLTARRSLSGVKSADARTRWSASATKSAANALTLAVK